MGLESNDVIIVFESRRDSGVALAKQFVESGARVVLDIPGSDLSDLDPTCIKQSHNRPIRADATINSALSSFGKVNGIVFHVAGQDSDIEDAAYWDTAREVDIKGAFQVAKAAWTIFKNQRCGSMLFSADSTFVTMALYGLTRTLSLEGAKYNIRINTFTRAGAGSGDVGAVHNDCNALFNSAAVSIIERSMKDWTGLLFRLEDSSLCKMRWERSNQVLLNPNQGSLTASALLSWKGNFEHFLPPNFAQKPADYAEIIQNAKKTPLVVANTSEPNFKGKVVVVTGAASGLGRCYATAFAKRDALVVANDIADLSPLLEEITSIGAKAVGCQASCEDGTQVINAALSAFGRIDILINNAGFLRDKSFQNMSEEQWDAVIRNHLNGTYQMTKAAWPHFVQQGKGVIVNTASTSGMFGHFGQANYSTAKLGIVGMTEVAARQGACHGIRVNAVAPVAGTNALQAAWSGSQAQNIAASFKPEFNAPMVMMLCSEEAKGFSGVLFEIGCGWHVATRLCKAEVAHLESCTDKSPSSILRGFQYPLAIETIKARQTQDFAHTEYKFGTKDVILYNLAVGASRSELRFVFEGSETFQAIPTFAMIPFFSRAVISHHGSLLSGLPSTKSFLGEHYLEIFEQSIPTKGHLVSKGRLVEVLDKKTAAIAITGYTTFDKHTERRLFYNEVSFFITGAGDFGGKSLRSGNFSGALLPRQMPNTEPNCTLTYQTSEQQAALYRLTGDLEEVHIDPSASQNSGMGATPILHGACTLGIAGRHLLSSYGPYKKIRARFARPVIPGDKLKTEMWKCRKYVLFQVRLDKTGDICVKEGCVELCESAFKL